MLGVAGGTVARAYAKYFPDTIIDAVEIDGELFDIGRRWFGLEDRPQLRVHADDARPFLRSTDERYDFIFLDTYRQPYIPFYLATKEFFELARDRLAPGGAVIINVGHPEDSSRLEQVLTATMGAALPHVARDAVRDTNTLLIGQHGRAVARAPAGGRGGAARRPAPDRAAPTRAGSRARWRAGASTPTTRRRSSGSSTSRCSTTPAATGERPDDRAAHAGRRGRGRTRLAGVRAPRRRRGDGQRGRLRRRPQAAQHGPRARHDRGARRRRARRLRPAARGARRHSCTSCRRTAGAGSAAWLLRWTEEAGRAAGRTRSRQTLSENEHAGRALLEADGYERGWEDWIFDIELEREPDPPALPPGYALRDFVPGRDERDCHRVIDEAFGEWPERGGGGVRGLGGGDARAPGLRARAHRHDRPAGEQIVGVAVLIEDEDGSGSSSWRSRASTAGAASRARCCRTPSATAWRPAAPLRARAPTRARAPAACTSTSACA